MNSPDTLLTGAEELQQEAIQEQETRFELVNLAEYQENNSKWQACLTRGIIAMIAGPAVAQVSGYLAGGFVGWIGGVIGGLAMSAAWVILETLDGIQRYKLIRQTWHPVTENGEYVTREQAGRLLIWCENGDARAWRDMGEFAAIRTKEEVA